MKSVRAHTGREVALGLHRSATSVGRDRGVHVLLVPALLCVCAALLAACGGSSAGADSPATATAGPSAMPVPTPLITSGAPPAGAVDVVREFWRLVGQGRLAEAKRFVVAPGSPIQQWSGDDIGAAHFVRVVPGSVGGAPAQGATIEFAADVWIEPGVGPNVWGDAREHRLFEHVVRMSDGTWRMWDSGTGP